MMKSKPIKKLKEKDLRDLVNNTLKSVKPTRFLVYEGKLTENELEDVLKKIEERKYFQDAFNLLGDLNNRAAIEYSLFPKFQKFRVTRVIGADLKYYYFGTIKTYDVVKDKEYNECTIEISDYLTG